MEANNLYSEGIWDRRCFERNPCLPSVGRIEEFTRVSDKIRTVRGVSMVVEGEEPLFRLDLIPCVPFIA